MANRVNSEIKRKQYSSFRFFAKQQDEIYKDVIKGEIKEIIRDGSSMSDIKPKLNELLDTVSKHQFLENMGTTLTEELISYANDQLKKQAMGSFNYTPSKTMGDRTEINRYSILPWVKKKQYTINVKALAQREEILKANSRTLLELYTKELDAARIEGRKPYTTVLEALQQRQEELLKTAKGICDANETQHYVDPSLKAKYGDAKDTSTFLDFPIQSIYYYSGNSRIRETQLLNQKRIANFKSNALFDLSPATSAFKVIDKTIEGLKPEFEEYKKFLENYKQSLEGKYMHEKQAFQEYIERQEQELDKKRKDNYVALHGKPGETYDDIKAREAQELDRKKMVAAEMSKKRDMINKDYGKSIYGAENAEKLAERTRFEP